MIRSQDMEAIETRSPIHMRERSRLRKRSREMIHKLGEKKKMLQ
jgi:hypothetical protein